MSRPPTTTAGFVVSAKGRRVYLVDAEPGRDPGMSHHEAKELAQRLLHAAVAELEAAKARYLLDPAAKDRLVQELAQELTSHNRSTP